MDELDAIQYEKIAAEQKAFARVLEAYLPTGVYSNPRILNLFCGAVVEEPVIFRHFGSGTSMTSIDKSREMGDIAQRLGMKTFIHGDINTLEDHADGVYDIVLMRNPPIVSNDANILFSEWYALLEKLPNFMHQDGILFMTLLNSHEYRIVVPAIPRIGYRRFRVRENSVEVPSSALNDQCPFGKDTYILVAQKPNFVSKFSRFLSKDISLKFL